MKNIIKNDCGPIFTKNGKALKICFADGGTAFADSFDISTKVTYNDSQCHSTIRFLYDHNWYLRKYEEDVKTYAFYLYTFVMDSIDELLIPAVDANGDELFAGIAIVNVDDSEKVPDPNEDVKKENDSKVIHPNHYNQNGMEVWDVIKAFTSELSGVEAFYAGNVIKYVLRWNHKNGIEDLKKAKVYIDKIIEGRKK